MKNAVCDMCGKYHNTKDCTLCVTKRDSKLQSDCSWALQTLPNWIKYMEKQMKMITVEDIEKSVKLGPVLGPQSTILKKDNAFPLCIQISDVRLWLDLSCQSNSNWLSLIPSSPQDYNLIACQIGENIYYVAERNINASEELKVWYSPHYKSKIPKQILEEVQNLRQQKKCKENKFKNEEFEIPTSSENIAELNKLADKKLPNKISKKTEIESVVPVSLSTSHETNKLVCTNNSLQLFYEPQLLDNIYISNSSTPTVGLDLLSQQTQSSNKSCFTSISLAPVTILTSNFDFYSNSTQQTSYLLSSPLQNHAAVSTSNIESNQLLSYVAPRGKRNLFQNISGETSIDMETIQKSFTSLHRNNHSSFLTEERNSKNISHNYVANEDKLAHPEKILSSLQKICVKNKEITFIHKYSCEDVKNIDDVVPKKVDKVKESKDAVLNNNSYKTICINTQGRKYSKQNYSAVSLTLSKDNLENLIEVQEMSSDDSSYDIISLNISGNNCDLNRTPVCSVTKIQKKDDTFGFPLIKESSKVSDPLHKVNKLVSPENQICNQCEKNILNQVHFMQHLKNHLLAYLGKRFKCEFCHMLFKNIDNLKMHMITHKGKDSEGDESSSQNPNTGNILKSYCKNENESNLSKLWKGPFSCQICSKTCNSAKCLLRHFSKHTGEFYCNLCKKDFCRSQNLKKHICTHRPENALKCDICKKTFSSTRLLKFHSIEHNDKLKCVCCSRIFLCENYLKIHQMKCTKESSNFNSKEFASLESSRFSCHICDRNFSSVVFLQNHVAFCKQLDIVNKNGEVCCDRCGYICASPVELKFHHQTHTHPFLCLNCSQRFRSRGTYDCHICGIDFTCDFCDTKVQSFQDLYKHITCHGYPPFHCSRCRLPYYKIENVRLHECKLEVNEFIDKPIKNKVSCPYCPSLFATAHNLEKHMASLHCVPLKQKFFCGKCGRGFHRSDLLKSHEKVHLEPSFKCLKCPKKFKSQKSFYLHNIVHNGDFTFVCKLCSKGFTQKKYLIRHEKSHLSTIENKSTLLKCSNCCNVFASLQHLRSHMKLCSNGSEERHDDISA